MKRSSCHSNWFSPISFALAVALAFDLSVNRMPASQVVAYGYNIGTSPALTNAVAVGVLGYSLIALRADGTVAEWGNGASDPGVSNLVTIATGWSHGFGFRPDGTLVGWGDDHAGGISGKPANLTNAVAVAVGSYNTLAVLPEGTVIGWGEPSGLLEIPSGLSNVVAISIGAFGENALALCANGTVWEWGDGTTNVHPELSNVVAVAAAGAFMNAAIHFDGSVTAWPTNGYYPVPDDLTNIVAASGGANIVFLRKSGTVVPWGCECHSDFASISNLTDVAALAGGGGDGYNLNIFLLDYTNPPPILTADINNGLPRLRVTGLRFHNYMLEESTNLGSPADWTFKQNIVLPASAEFVVDLPPAADGNARFYRARLMP
jgi:alpha-tubulin suppressor-like RCC1 family protein